MLVRKATMNDLPWVIDLSRRVQEALTENGSLQHIGPLPYEMVKRSLQIEQTYILTEATHRLGSVLVDPIPGSSPLAHPQLLKQWGLEALPGPHWYLHALMLEPGEQGKGLGKLLLAGVKQWVVPTQGSIVLDCWAGNQKLRNFYLNAGFNFHGVFPENNFEIAVFYYTPHSPIHSQE